MTTSIVSERLITLPEVIAITTLGRSEIYERMTIGTFPKNHPLEGRRVAWRLSEVMAWIDRVAPRQALTFEPQPLPLPNPAPVIRRGRPPGSGRNARISADTTPRSGQQFT
jgi:prophage regulatory protein